MTNEQLYAHVDHTNLKPEATPADIIALCDEAIAHGTASVCINPVYVPLAAEHLAGHGPVVCTVVGFPLGACTTASKAAEAADAIANGASEVDMVIHIGGLKAGDYEAVLEDIRAVQAAIGDHLLKVIVETCLLTEQEKIKACELVSASGAAYIKTSTGFSTGGATFADVELFAKHVAPHVKIKAAGGIRSREDMERFLALGASRLGTSSAVKILG